MNWFRRLLPYAVGCDGLLLAVVYLQSRLDDDPFVATVPWFAGHSISLVCMHAVAIGKSGEGDFIDYGVGDVITAAAFILASAVLSFVIARILVNRGVVKST